MNLALGLAVGAATLNLSFAALLAAISRAPGWKTARLFALLALTAGLYNAFSFGFGFSGLSTTTYIWLGRLIYFIANLHCAGWVVYAYRGVDGDWLDLPKRVRWSFAAATALGLLFLLTGWGFEPRVEEVAVPWADVTYHFPVTQPVRDLYGLLMPGLLAAALIRLIHRYRAGERLLLPQLTGFVLFFICAVDEVLVANRVIRFLSLADLGFVAVVLPLSLQTVRRIIGDARRLDALSRDLRREVERRGAELARSEQRYRLLVEASPDAILFAGLNGRILTANPCAAGILGFPGAASLAGLRAWALVAPESRRTLRPRLAAMLAAGSIHAEANLRRRDGSEFPAEFSGVAVRDEDGRFAGYLVIARDIGPRRRAEAERAALEDQLHQARKLESIGRLAGGVAHDFNNLLTVINGYAALLLGKAGQTGAVREPLSHILRAGERAADLTRQLLAFSRRQIIQPSPVDLNRAIQDNLGLLRRLAGENVHIATELGSDLGPVLADPGQITQILLNLTGNARDAMPAGGRLTIRTTASDAIPAPGPPDARSGPWIRLSVRDEGSGMDRETVRQVFEPFFTTKEAGKGTGLGLSTVYGIVMQSRGWITVESEPGKGTEFHIYLPRSKAAAPAAAPAGTGERESSPGTETILLVEDQDDLRRLAREVLEAADYLVIEASNGAEALAASGSFAGPIHLLLTDVVMPGMNGRELALELEKRRPGLKTLYSSGYAGEVMSQLGVPEQDVAFLAKPFTPAALKARVRAVLG